jgi:predicted amidohydrolase
MQTSKFKAAVVQTAPPYPPSKKGSVEKISEIIREAGAKGARIIVFPETFIPAYPNWAIEARPPIKWNTKWLEVVKESIEIPSPEINKLCEEAKTAGSLVCLGVNERDRDYPNSVYNTLVFIGSEGKVVGKHRKLTPVYREKLFWTSGSPEDLRCVFSTPYGRVGGLICAEHLHTVLKSAMAIQREEVHIACYPGWSLLPRHVMDTSIRQYALECQCYVLASSQYLKGKPENSDDDEANWDFYGGSGIVDPMGNYLAGPSYCRDEVLYADIEMDKITERKTWIDATGKDARWDVIPFLQTLR